MKNIIKYIFDKITTFRNRRKLKKKLKKLKKKDPFTYKH